MDNSPATVRQVHGSERTLAADFMQSEFRNHFNARIADDTDEVYILEDATGQTLAAFGLNRDPSGFFCRHYVGNVADAVAAVFGLLDAEPCVIELSHLCVVDARSFCPCVPVIAAFLHSQADYLVCTATRQLAAYFRRRQLAPHHIADARIDALPQARRFDWGSYYDRDPVVVTGDLAHAAKVLDKDGNDSGNACVA